MIVSVASGKGGTGKTTVATSLARSLDRPVQFLDCDVEEPNGHLFLHPEIEEHTPVYTMVPELIEEQCSGCRQCAEICRFRAITVVAGKALIFPELCHGCGGCLEVCPEQSLIEGRRELGELESGRSGVVEFIHGRMRVGEAMSPPLIKRVRQVGEGTLTIIDAPPGTSCPVIAAMKNTDFVLLVTEPTPFGLHDLKLAVESVRLLGIPCGLVINRSDMGDDQVRQYARQVDVPVLLEIPFSREVAEAYSRGELLVEARPDWQERFVRMYEQIEMLANSQNQEAC